MLAVVGFAYAWRADRPEIYSTIVLSLGALHLAYDGFIWKLRKPATAASLEIGSSTELQASTS